jgi:small subunit ribosomal protein S13
MLLIFGVTLDKEKKIIYALPKLYGVGRPASIRICKELGLSLRLKIKQLTNEQQYYLSKKVKEEYRLEDSLREQIKSDVRRYMSNGSIRGFRHRYNLPVRGQRTQSNGRTPRRVIHGISMKGRIAIKGNTSNKAKTTKKRKV